MIGRIEVVGTFCFGLAVLHSFFTKGFRSLQIRSRKRSPQKKAFHFLFHLLGDALYEVELVFGLWAVIFLAISAVLNFSGTFSYLQARSFREVFFVFFLMIICSTKPVLKTAAVTIEKLVCIIPLDRGLAFYLVVMIFGPLMGSFITEPAAMTVVALILAERLYSQPISEKLKYTSLGLLFVNVSIGGLLTPFAAPPVLMVAHKWNWNVIFMLSQFGWKALAAMLVSTCITIFLFKKELRRISWTSPELSPGPGSRRANLGRVQLKEALYVGIFLGGLVILGGAQTWWVKPLIESLNSGALYVGSIVLTAIIDNAALTYLGSQVDGISEINKYFLVAGSVVGGGLTAIANAPNPAGIGILKTHFEGKSVNPFRLFLSALPPTIVAAICFLL